MSRQDRIFAETRALALRKPLTRAQSETLPFIALSGGITIALSVNK